MKIRPATEGDFPFILDFWLKSYYDGVTGYRFSPKVFFKEHQKQIEKLYSEGKLVCQVACLPDDEDVILGFAVFGTDYTLHYIGVKQTFKKLGVAKHLLKSFYKDRSEIIASHWTKDIKHIQKVYKVNYNPYRFYQ